MTFSLQRTANFCVDIRQRIRHCAKMTPCCSLIAAHRSVRRQQLVRIAQPAWEVGAAGHYRCRRNGSATGWWYSSTADYGEINNCQQRLQLPYIPCVGLLAGGDFVNDERQEGGVAMASLRIAAFALALLGSSLLVGQASAAMPVNGLTEASKQISSVDKVWCCGRWRGGWGYHRWGYGRCRSVGLPWMGPWSVLGSSIRLWMAPVRLASLLVVIAIEPADCGQPT